ncbi:MAG: DNRLRE domain-containing protein [Chromatiaceae bacterium]|jgi:hypothetical protein|nr:DNRLRE domain-containing protein [Chromatiaceae bacterium]
MKAESIRNLHLRLSRVSSTGRLRTKGTVRALPELANLATIVLIVLYLVVGSSALADTGVLREVPIADAYVSEEAPNTNHGSLPHLLVGLTPEFGYLYRSYLLFDIEGLPADAEISSATLKIYLHSTHLGDDVDIDLGAVDESWSEAGPEGVAWGNPETLDRQPASTPLGSVRLTATAGWQDIDVSSLLRDWFDGGRANHGLRLSLTGEDRYKTEGPYLLRSFYSRESPICAPYLEIVYTAADVPPETPAPSCTPLSDTTAPEITSIEADPDPAIADHAVQISVEATDPEGMYRLQLLRGATVVDDITSDTGETSLSLTVSEALDPGRHHYSALAWNRSMLTAARAKSLRVDHDGEPPSVAVSHTPAEPPAGDSVTFVVEAEDDSGIRHVTLTVQGVPHDRALDPETAVREEFSYTLDPDMRVVRYSAAATDREGRYASTGTKYLLIGNTGDESDEDGLADDIEVLMGLDPASNDTDGDGLYDGWEVIGLDRDHDGTLDLDLPMLGANPHHKDVFVEIDWMEDATRSLRPHPTAVQALVNAFREYGIRLHVDTGNLGGGNAVPYEANTCDYESTWFAETKGANFDRARRGIFYYIAAMTAGEGCGSKSKGAGNIILRSSSVHGYTVNMMHELGHDLGVHHGGQKALTEPRSADTLGPNGDIISDNAIDWATDDENYKPNYLSIMNYQYQWQLRICVVPDAAHPCTCTGHLDATQRAAVANPCDDVFPMTFNLSDRPLDEAALDESAGLSAPADIGNYIWRRSTAEMELYRPTLQGWYYIERYPTSGCCTADCSPDPYDTVLTLADGSPVDWNFNGTIDATPVAYDLNRYWSRTQGACSDALDSPLMARFEVPLLRTKIWGNINFGFSETDLSPVDPPAPIVPADGEVADDMDNDGDGRIDEGFPDTDADSIADPVDNCPFTDNPDQFDTAASYRGDACTGLPEAPTGLDIAVIDGVTTLLWEPSTTANILGYNVYRKSGDGRDFRRLGISFPTTLDEHSFADTECVAGAIYSLGGVNVYMDEGRLSGGIVVADTNGDGVCDQVAARLRDPYGTAAPTYTLQWDWILLIFVFLLIAAAILVVLVRTRHA